MYKRSLFVKQSQPKPPKKRLVRYILWAAFKRMLMVFGALFLMGVVSASIMSFVILGEGSEKTPEQFVLHLPIESGFIEHENDSGSYGFGTQPYLMREVSNALDAAAVDRRVKGLVVTLEGGSLSLAHIQEFRAALARFRSTGKKARIYASEYGTGQGLSDYYLASAFDEIWMQPMGTLSITGLHVEQPFLRKALNKIGVQPQFFRRWEHKTLFESFTDESMSQINRISISSLVGDLVGTIIDDVAQGRSVEADGFKKAVNTGLYVDRQALNAKLIDRLDDYETLQREIRIDLTGNPSARKRIFFEMERYIKSVKKSEEEKNLFENKKQAALVYVMGTIMSVTDAAHANTLYGETADTAEDIAADILDAVDDDDIAIIVMRVDSPGGSPVASETIRRALLVAKEKGKKVIVSMGAMAASGGYWVAAPADHIFALPGTLTGSIGVAGGKFVLKDMWAKIGINWDDVQYGDNADLWSFNKAFSEGGTEQMNNMMDVIYNGFIDRVAEGRGIDREKAESVARGRVWSGKQAVKNGLVDELGGLDEALDYAARQAGLSSRHDMEIVVYPQPLSPLEKIIELMEGQVRVAQTVKAQAALLQEVEPLLKSYHAARTQSDLITWQPPILE